ncbi:MAG: LPS export ABC transporter permease LptF [Pseudomonadota bacterium]
MRILDKYLYIELLKTFFAVLTVLLLITFGAEATKLLAMAVEGKVPSSIVLQLLLLKVPPALEVILPLVALLSVMLTIGRLYQDQEMVVMSSCGISPRYFQKRVLFFLIPLVLLTAWISLVVTPWSYKAERLLISEAQTLTPVSGLVPGRFNILPNDAGVFYTKSISGSGELSTIWIQRQSQAQAQAQAQDAEQDLILVAPKGRFEWIDGRLVLVLEEGYSYLGMHYPATTVSGEVEVQAFKRFEVLIPELSSQPTRPDKLEVGTDILWGSDTLEHQALLQWRLVTPFGVLILGLIGLKMSRTGPREGRFVRVFYALLLYIVYSQLLVVGKESLSDGIWPATIGLWPIPILFLLFALVEFKPLTAPLIAKFKSAELGVKPKASESTGRGP